MSDLPLPTEAEISFVRNASVAFQDFLLSIVPGYSERHLGPLTLWELDACPGFDLESLYIPVDCAAIMEAACRLMDSKSWILRYDGFRDSDQPQYTAAVETRSDADTPRLTALKALAAALENRPS